MWVFYTDETQSHYPKIHQNISGRFFGKHYAATNTRCDVLLRKTCRI